MTVTEQGILKTLVFYELFRRSCSFLELLRITAAPPLELLNALHTLLRRGTITAHGGRYFLSDINLTRDTRGDEIARHHGWKRIQQLLPLFATNPFIRVVAVANSLAFDSMRRGSDIDLFVVTTRRRLYLARALLVIPLKLFRLRPHETQRSPVCVSFIVDDAHTDMTELLLPHDVYFAHWAASLIVAYENGVSDHHSDLRHIVTDAPPAYTQEYTSFTYRSWWSRCVSFIIQVVCDYDILERFAYTLQRWYLPASLKSIEAAQQRTGTIITPYMFKAHLHDERESLRDRFHARLAQLNVLL